MVGRHAGEDRGVVLDSGAGEDTAPHRAGNWIGWLEKEPGPMELVLAAVVGILVILLLVLTLIMGSIVGAIVLLWLAGIGLLFAVPLKAHAAFVVLRPVVIVVWGCLMAFLAVAAFGPSDARYIFTSSLITGIVTACFWPYSMKKHLGTDFQNGLAFGWLEIETVVRHYWSGEGEKWRTSDAMPNEHDDAASKRPDDSGFKAAPPAKQQGGHPQTVGGTLAEALRQAGQHPIQDWEDLKAQYKARFQAWVAKGTEKATTEYVKGQTDRLRADTSLADAWIENQRALGKADDVRTILQTDAYEREGAKLKAEGDRNKQQAAARQGPADKYEELRATFAPQADLEAIVQKLKGDFPDADENAIRTFAQDWLRRQRNPRA